MDSFTLEKIEFDAVRRILARFCSSKPGKDLAACISPSLNPRTITHWLRQVSQMVRAVGSVSLPPLGGVEDIAEPLQRARPGGGAGGEDFAAIASTLQAAENVRKYLDALPEDLETLSELAGRIPSFGEEIRAINSVINGDGSIRDDASPRLGRLRSQISETSQQIHDVIYGYLHQPQIRRLLQNVTVTLHEDRFVLPVKAQNRGRLTGVVHRSSGSGATVFVEPAASVELNNRLADFKADERAEIERLLEQLALQISARTGDIRRTVSVLGQVDLISAKAQYAYQNDMTCPQISERGPLDLHKARHPLLIEQAKRDDAKPVVPIDVRLGEDFDLLIITGSNTGGKTVALKTVALLSVMAQSGMHVPASAGSKLPVFRKIFIDVGDEQSLQQSLSTFGSHIGRINHVLRKADRSCLVLLDELGAGTDPDEGGAISQAVLDELRRIGCMAMVTTHLGVLKAYALNHRRADNASVEFDTKTLRPTYHLHIGTPGESHAITVAGRLGLPKRIVSNARRHLGRRGAQFRRAIRATGEARKEAEAARSKAREAHLAAESQMQNYEAELAEVNRIRNEFRDWLASIPQLKPGQEVFVASLNDKARLIRLELHKQQAVVESGNIQHEVPLGELMPDMGQLPIRRQIAELRDKIVAEARRTQSARSEAEHVRKEYKQSLSQLKQRQKRFDAWLEGVKKLKVGRQVRVAGHKKPATVVAVDLPNLRATVETDGRRRQVALQELLPEAAAFETKPPTRKQKRKHGRRKDKPVRHRRADSAAAKKNRQKILQIEPGRKVFVVPFKKQATLIRTDPDKDLAVVQSGAFEMEVPIADIEPAPKDK